MKKIFAIALALVMVLSMASAFASACVTGPFDWSCATTTNKCGKAKFEVIPYVTTNAACNELSYVQSNCAAAINGENVYYALKLTIDKDVDPEWWATVKLYYSIAGMTKNKEKTAVANVELDMNKYPEDTSKNGWVYYLTLNADGTQKAWSKEVTEDDNFDIANVMNKSVVKEYAKAKVCAYLEAESTLGNKVTVGNYMVEYALDGNQKDYWLNVYNKDGSTKLVAYKIDAKSEKVVKIDYTSACGEADYATIKAFMGLDIGTCVTKDAIKANFGWKESPKSCYQWATKGTAVVDPECKIEIPKTGDVSVVAYAVMALVAAAGAMGLKK